MTALECHIDFDTKLQKMSSNRYRAFEPEEMDWVLNDTALKLIDDQIHPKGRTRVSGGKQFQDNKARYDDYQNLVTTKLLTTFKAGIEFDGYADDAMYAILPSNYFKLIDDVSKTVYKCNGIEKTLTNKTLYISKFVLVDDTVNTITDFYKDFSLTLNTGSSTLLFDLDNYYPNGFSDKDLKFVLINLILEEINRTSQTVQIYWEEFNGQYYNNTFIFVSETSFTNISVNMNGGIIIPMEQLTLQIYTVDSTIKRNYYSDRLIDREDTRNMMSFSFGSTKYNSPLSNLQNKSVIIFQDNTFVVEQLVLEYIRFPRRMDINLGRTLEFKEDVQKKIVDTAVQRVAAILQAGNFQGLLYNNQELLKN